MSIEETRPNQMPLTDLETLEPFVEQFAESVATQEGALQQGPSLEVQQALMRVRQSWLERHTPHLAFGAGLVGAIILFRLIR